MPPLDKETTKLFGFLKGRLPGWRATVHKRTQAKKWQKYIDECDNAIKPGDLKNLMSSPPAIKGQKAVTAAKAGQDLTVSQFTAFKDLLLASLSLQNGSRPGTVNNATVKDFEQTRTEEKSGKLVMLVARHKHAEHGPSMICMDADLKERMRIYVYIVRPQFVKEGENALFIKADGTEYPEGTIRKRITAFYKKVGVRPDIRISSTRVRKMISTQVHCNEPEAAGTVRRLMAHSQRTAELSYVRHTLTHMAATAHDIVCRNTRTDTIKTGKAAVAEKDQEEHMSTNSSLTSRPFSEEEKDAIDLLFAHDISSRTPVTLAQVRNIMVSNLSLRVISNRAIMVKKVLDRVRYTQKNVDSSLPESLGESDK